MSKSKPGRQAVIINEIKFWKQNKMLPDQYCDYLMALYSNGEENLSNPSIKKAKMKMMSVNILFSAVVMSISLFVIHFTELSVVLQTAILTCFVVLLYGMGIYYSKKKVSMAAILISASFIILLGSIDLTEEIFQGSPFSTYAVLFSNCLLWIVLGLGQRRIYFTLSGGIGSLVLIISILL
ncbi:hypothetical protein HP456_09980 [Bacillus haikouensis]|uniref:hypothetical protein n=1 Tax=Bacillus haikouensis TaxID=1510468 RepID=UPI001551ADB6|nr:hypothetical protein [Bacillus haikouensis]NQD66245.1 hypothetical protein [Bacillus haikouensis]